MGICSFVAEEIDVCFGDSWLELAGGEELRCEAVWVAGVSRGEVFWICGWAARSWCFCCER